MKEPLSIKGALSVILCCMVISEIMGAFQWTRWSGIWFYVAMGISFFNTTAAWSALWSIGLRLWKKRNARKRNT